MDIREGIMMNIELTQEQLELVLTGLSMVRKQKSKELRDIVTLEKKLITMGKEKEKEKQYEDSPIEFLNVAELLFKNEEDKDKEENDHLSQHDKIGLEFFDTFNFEVEADKFSQSIIDDGMNIRLINGAQDQLGIEYTYDDGKNKHTVFVSKKEKPILLMILIQVYNILANRGEAILAIRELVEDVYRYYGYNINVANTRDGGSDVTKFILSSNEIHEKFIVTVFNHLFGKSNEPILTIKKHDGQIAEIFKLVQLEIIINFIEYHM